MTKQIIFATTLFLAFGTCFTAGAQILDVGALGKYNPSVLREVYAVSRYVKLDAARQQALADAFEKEDAKFVSMVTEAGGVLTVADTRKLEKMRARTLAAVLTGPQLEQYYRGVYDKEADAEGTGIADRLQKKYGLTDQNWKFIRVAFYKIGLDSRVITKMMADRPAEAKKRIEELRRQQLATIEAKGGIRVNDAGTKVEIIKPFDPNALHRD